EEELKLRCSFEEIKKNLRKKASLITSKGAKVGRRRRGYDESADDDEFSDYIAEKEQRKKDDLYGRKHKKAKREKKQRQKKKSIGIDASENSDSLQVDFTLLLDDEEDGDEAFGFDDEFDEIMKRGQEKMEQKKSKTAKIGGIEKKGKEEKEDHKKVQNIDELVEKAKIQSLEMEEEDDDDEGGFEDIFS
ncbi:hypothetical protein ADUPG1_008787, partial [Aduncisulcus paluster]